MTEPGPSKGLTPLREAVNDTLAATIWGMEGTGKTLHVLRYWPLPIVVLNLDRPLTRAHLGYLDPDRIDQIHVRNLRESLKDIDHNDAMRIKSVIEADITANLDWLKGGTLLLDGGTMYRSVLKLADPVIGPSMDARTADPNAKRVNPKERERINAYLGQLVSYIQDQNINFVITGHAAFAWKLGEQGLEKTKNVYPKLDDILFERVNLSVLLYKRCECGRNIVSQDGSCSAENPAGTPGVAHQGRQHISRIVTNKFFSASEGTEWSALTYSTISALCFDSIKAKLLMEANPLGKRP